MKDFNPFPDLWNAMNHQLWQVMSVTLYETFFYLQHCLSFEQLAWPKSGIPDFNSLKKRTKDASHSQKIIHIRTQNNEWDIVNF